MFLSYSYRKLYMNSLSVLIVLLCLLILGAQNYITGESAFLDSIPVRKTTVGDIDVGYKMLGSGEPLLLIPGFSMTMDMWDPVMIEKLSTNRTVILFDNRGMGSTVATHEDNKELLNRTIGK